MSDGAKAAGGRRGVLLRVMGRVQGVGFRYFTLRTARSLGVVGRVANRPDGSVEVRAVADGATLTRFKEELRRGPVGSRVAGIEEERLADPPEWRRFEITHV